jgi:hypothetical protein
VLQLPDAEGGEEKAFSASERPDGGQLFRLIIAAGDLPRTAAARFGFADPAGAFANWKMTTGIHNH